MQLDLLAALESAGCRLGASPDGIVARPDGTLDVLEVKNHCPFREGRKGRLVVKDKV